MTRVAQLDLPRIDETENGPALEAALVKVGIFLAEEGLTGVFAVRKLHRHFDLAVGEVLLSSLASDEPVMWTRVVPRGRVMINQACQWGFFPDGTCVVLGWWSTEVQGVPEIRAALSKIGVFLSHEGLTGLLAVELLDCDLQVDAGMALLETTDVVARVQRTTAIPVAEVHGFPAAWSISPAGKPIGRRWCLESGGDH